MTELEVVGLTDLEDAGLDCLFIRRLRKPCDLRHSEFDPESLVFAVLDVGSRVEPGMTYSEVV